MTPEAAKFFALAIAFCGLCASIAATVIYTKDPRIACIEQRGDWEAGWTYSGGKCRFVTAQKNNM